MSDNDNGLVVARYENREGLLLVSGAPLTAEVLNDMPSSKYTYSPAGYEGKACGTASIRVGSEQNAVSLGEELKRHFQGLGIIFEYRGHTAVRNGSLPGVFDTKGLCYLVARTMEAEALGKVDPSTLEKIDYNAVALDLIEHGAKREIEALREAQEARGR